MSRPAYKLFFIYTKDMKNYVDTCLGLRELCEFLKRDKNSVQNTLWRIKKGQLKHIRDYDGNYYSIVSEDEITNKNVRRKK